MSCPPQCSTDPVLSVEFSPVDRNTIVSCGRSHITFWLHEHGMLAKRQGVFEAREKPKYVTAIAFLNSGDVLSGDSSGNLVIWYRGEGKGAIRVLKGIVVRARRLTGTGGYTYPDFSYLLRKSILGLDFIYKG